MTNVPAPVNLDKLRNAVQKFGAMSFTTPQILSEYHRGDIAPTDSDVLHFEALLQRHALLLHIGSAGLASSGATVWQQL